MVFTVEEITLLKGTYTSGLTREDVIENLEVSLPYYTEDEKEISDLVAKVVDKLKAISDLEYKLINLSMALNVGDDLEDDDE